MAQPAAAPPKALPVAPLAPAAPAPPAKPALPDDGTRVAVLGYHEFNEKMPETEMRMHTSKFRKQMQAIKDSGATVINLPDFVAWKNGQKSLPKKCVLIGIDDGWLSVYTDAYPILKEYGFPFTLYLYKNYLDGGGKSMTTAMVKEMMAHGATIGSHSTSHPFPIVYRKQKKKGPQALDSFLRVEFGESKRFLEEKFGAKVTTFAYPGGYVMDEMLPLADEFGYTQLFTVLPGKVSRPTDDKRVPRYMILGTADSVFDMALRFDDHTAAATATPAAGGAAAAPAPVRLPFPVAPEPGAIVNSRLPEISVDFASGIDAIDPATLVMRLGGFGQVPAAFDPATNKLTWTINRRLRQNSCNVTVTWKDKVGKPAAPLKWSFHLDRTAAYLPEVENEPKADVK